MSIPISTRHGKFQISGKEEHEIQNPQNFQQENAVTVHAELGNHDYRIIYYKKTGHVTFKAYKWPLKLLPIVDIKFLLEKMLGEIDCKLKPDEYKIIYSDGYGERMKFRVDGELRFHRGFVDLTKYDPFRWQIKVHTTNWGYEWQNGQTPKRMNRDMIIDIILHYIQTIRKENND